MIRHIITLLWRNYSKNIHYLLINLLSMGIGLACIIVAYLHHVQNNSFDMEHELSDQIYRINYSVMNDIRNEHFGVIPTYLSDQVTQWNEATPTAQYTKRSGSIVKEDNFFELKMGFADSNFLNMFTFPLLHGNVKSLEDPSNVIISYQTSLKLFGDMNSVGQTIEFTDRGNNKFYQITGIFQDFKPNSSFTFDAITNISGFDSFYNEGKRDDMQQVTIFMHVKNHNDLLHLTNRIQSLDTKHSPEINKELKPQYYLDPLIGMANRASELNVQSSLKEALPRAATIAPASLAILILLLASVTFIQTSIASSAHRLKEIGIRSVLGNSRNKIIMQLLLENIFLCLISLLIALPLTDFLAGEFSSLVPMLNLKLIILDHFNFILFCIVFAISVGIIAGFYPSFYITSFDASQVLKGGIKYGTVNMFSKILLGFQFCFSMFTIVTCIFFIQNSIYHNEIDLGFDTDQTVVVRFPTADQKYQLLKNELANNSDIVNITEADHHVARNFYTTSIDYQGKKSTVIAMDVGQNYLQVTELQLTQGRDFNSDYPTDYQSSVLINEKMAQSLDMDHPIGEQIIYNDSLKYTIIGVLKNFYFDSFNSPIYPLIIRPKASNHYKYMIVKTSCSNLNSVQQEIKNTWETLFNNNEYDIKTGRHARFESNFTNEIMIKVFSFFGAIAVLLSLIGLYNLISLNMTSRSKEIGIRKVVGASSISIIKTLNKSYFSICVIAILIGTGLSYLLIPSLMDEIWAFHINATPTIAISSILILVSLSVSCISLVVSKKTNTNPIKLLKME